MRTAQPILVVLALVVPVAAEATPYGYGAAAAPGAFETTAGIGGRAPWSQPYEYDSGSDNDRRPELPYYQQGRGQQTGGPARNLLPDDGFHIFPR
jgi:hypothetical protein